jgi:bacterioferritin
MAELGQASEELQGLLNEAISRELQVSIQYMWQHVLWRGVKGLAVKDVFRKISIVEMKHAEAIAERLAYFGGMPTSKPAPIFVGENLRQMIEQDQKNEEDGIHLYQHIIEVAGREGDVVTRKLFEDIIVEEEDHHDTFTSLLEDL